MPSIFTRIIKGELPGHFVWKDEVVVAFLTIEPFRDGHVLVVPRDEVDHFQDLDESVAAHLMVVAQRIARVQKDCFASKRVGLMIAGLEVPHVHIHLVPLDRMSELSFDRAHPAAQSALQMNAARIREALRAAGHREADF